MPQTFKFASTTDVEELIPVRVVPVQWFEPPTVLDTKHNPVLELCSHHHLTDVPWFSILVLFKSG